jgi:hypothetical protein
MKLNFTFPLGNVSGLKNALLTKSNALAIRRTGIRTAAGLFGE